MAMGTKGTKGSSDPSAIARHSRESGNPAPLAFDSMKSLDPRLRGDDGNPSDPATSTALPRLRFPEFLDAREWSVKPMDKLYSFMRNNALSRAKLNYERGAAKNIHYGDIHTKFPALFDITKERVPFINDSEDVPNADSEDCCIEGDLIFADASEDTNDVGKSMEVVWLNGERLLSGQHTILARRKDETIVLRFGGHLFRSGYVRSQIKREAQGTKVYSISPSRLGGVQVAYPIEPAEQQKIADCLTSLDEVIAAQVRKVEALKAHKRGLMQQLFPREGETRPRLRFPELRNAQDWTLGKASDIVVVLQGYGFPERLQGSTDGEFPFYKVSDISACVDAGGIFLDEANNHIDAGVLEELRAKPMPVGATVFAKIGEAIRSNKRAITTRLCLVDNNAAGVKAIEGLAQDRFVYYLWCQVLLIEHAGGVVPAVNKSTIEQIAVCYPEPDEQQRIADCLSSLDTRITAETRQIAALKTHKQGLMQQLFPAPEAASA